MTVHEYPVWFYRQWPWTMWSGSRSERKTFLKLALTSPMGLGVLFGLPARRDVADALAQKRDALRKHRSQVERLCHDVRWATLGGVGRGSLLECLLRDYELFRSHEICVQPQAETEPEPAPAPVAAVSAMPAPAPAPVAPPVLARTMVPQAN